MQTVKETDKYADSQRNIQTDKYADSQRNIQTDKYADSQTNIQTDKYADSQTNIQTDKYADSQRNIQTNKLTLGSHLFQTSSFLSRVSNVWSQRALVHRSRIRDVRTCSRRPVSSWGTWGGLMVLSEQL